MKEQIEQRKLSEIYSPRNEELFNNLEKQYQELAKVKAESEQIEKQAIEEMAKVIKSSLDGLGSGNHHFTGNEISTMFATRLYDAGYRKQSEWTSVDERLPEESGIYLVHSYLGNRLILDYSARHKLFNSFDSYSTEQAKGFAIKVTHWMPLPELPKMRKEDEGK